MAQPRLQLGREQPWEGLTGSLLLPGLVCSVGWGILHASSTSTSLEGCLFTSILIKPPLFSHEQFIPNFLHAKAVQLLNSMLPIPVADSQGVKLSHTPGWQPSLEGWQG